MSEDSFDEWSIFRVFKCQRSRCDEEYVTDDFDAKARMNCYCGVKLRWIPRAGTVHRYFRCKICNDDFESLAYR